MRLMNCQKRETERKWTKTRVLLARVSRHENDIFWKKKRIKIVVF